MQDLDSAIPEPESARLGHFEYTNEQMDSLCEAAVQCTGFSMAPVMSVVEGDDLDAAPLSVERQILVMMACEEGAVSFTMPMIAFDSFVSMACDVHRKVRSHVYDRVVDVEAAIDATVDEFRQQLGGEQ